MTVDSVDFARLLGLDAQVHQAVGMMAVQIGDSLEAAAMRLMAAADAHQRALEAVAADVVARRVRFSPER
ncbi:MAG TPA: hypothetical protein VF230_09300 [Acidimicrobiales bacterium]